MSSSFPLLSARELVVVREMPNRLAVVIAAPHSQSEDVGIYNDFDAMQEVLLRRGFSKDTIETLMLDGQGKQSILMKRLAEIHTRISSWSGGQLFFYYTGHGTFDPVSGEPGLALGGKEVVYWSEVFKALDAPKSLDLIVLPDC